MEPLIIKVVLCIIVPVLLLCGMLEKRSRYLALAVCAGCLMCMASYYLNTWIQELSGCSYFHLSTSIAPFVEESAKFIPILAFSLIVGKERRPLLCFSFAVGMGFAIIENSLMLSQSAASTSAALMLLRGVGAGLMHGMSTVIVGAGIHLASQDSRLLFTGTAAALFFAMMYHGAYNALVMTEGLKYFGIFLPLLSYALALTLMNKSQIQDFFANTDADTAAGAHTN